MHPKREFSAFYSLLHAISGEMMSLLGDLQSLPAMLRHFLSRDWHVL